MGFKILGAHAYGTAQFTATGANAPNLFAFDLHLHNFTRLNPITVTGSALCDGRAADIAIRRSDGAIFGLRGSLTRLVYCLLSMNIASGVSAFIGLTPIPVRSDTDVLPGMDFDQFDNLIAIQWDSDNNPNDYSVWELDTATGLNRTGLRLSGYFTNPSAKSFTGGLTRIKDGALHFVFVYSTTAAYAIRLNQTTGTMQVLPNRYGLYTEGRTGTSPISPEFPVFGVSPDAVRCSSFSICAQTTAGQSAVTCTCATNWSDTNCTTPPPLICSSSPCENGGTCYETPLQLSCLCPTGYTGNRCEIALSACTASTSLFVYDYNWDSSTESPLFNTNTYSPFVFKTNFTQHADGYPALYDSLPRAAEIPYSISSQELYVLEAKRALGRIWFLQLSSIRLHSNINAIVHKGVMLTQFQDGASVSPFVLAPQPARAGLAGICVLPTASFCIRDSDRVAFVVCRTVPDGKVALFVHGVDAASHTALGSNAGYIGKTEFGSDSALGSGVSSIAIDPGTQQIWLLQNNDGDMFLYLLNSTNVAVLRTVAVSSFSELGITGGFMSLQSRPEPQRFTILAFDGLTAEVYHFTYRLAHLNTTNGRVTLDGVIDPRLFFLDNMFDPLLTSYVMPDHSNIAPGCSVFDGVTGATPGIGSVYFTAVEASEAQVGVQQTRLYVIDPTNGRSSLLSTITAFDDAGEANRMTYYNGSYYTPRVFAGCDYGCILRFNSSDDATHYPLPDIREQITVLASVETEVSTGNILSLDFARNGTVFAVYNTPRVATFNTSQWSVIDVYTVSGFNLTAASDFVMWSDQFYAVTDGIYFGGEAYETLLYKLHRVDSTSMTVSVVGTLAAEGCFAQSEITAFGDHCIYACSYFGSSGRSIIGRVNMFTGQLYDVHDKYRADKIFIPLMSSAPAYFTNDTETPPAQESSSTGVGAGGDESSSSTAGEIADDTPTPTPAPSSSTGLFARDLQTAGLSTGAIVGIAIGGLVVVLALICALASRTSGPPDVHVPEQRSLLRTKRMMRTAP